MTTRKKKIIDEKEHEEEKYKFMKEQIKPQRRKCFFKALKKLGATVVLALIFGGVSAVVFCAVRDNLEKKEGRSVAASGDVVSKELSTVTPSPSNTPKEDKTDEKSGISKTDAEAIYDYSKLNRRLASIGESCKYSLVTVSGFKKNSELDSFLGQNSKSSYGIFVQEDKERYYILTCSDIVKDAKKIDVKFYNGNEAEAEIVAFDNNIKLAIISIKKEDVNATTKSGVDIAEFASLNSNLSLGSNVIAIGAPNGVMYSVMLGNITKSNIKVGITDNEIKLFSTDIPYSPNGNGIVLNTRGRIIGLITNDYHDYIGDNAIGFIEFTSVQDIIRKLLNGSSSAYLGVEGCNVDAATAKEHDLSKGVYITSVHSNSPAYSAGMRVGDVITKMDGINIISMTQVHCILIAKEPKDSIKVTIARKSNKSTKYKKLKVVLK